MSAILGIYRFDEECVDEANLRKMLSSMHYRGPDGEGIWANGSIGFGHLMLHTTPESLYEHLPFEEGDLAITADARIDNREELLALFSDCHENVPDSHLILRAYKEWGERCPEKLAGDFAFAVWDCCKEELFCARDHMGVKPFYYFLSDRTFIFASAIKGILSNPEVPRSINEKMVANYLLASVNDRKITFYQDIFRLPAAHTITLSYKSSRLRKYWSLDPNREINLSSDEEYENEFRRIFTEAVRCRTRSVYPVGAMLSGGLDSSSVVCVARKLLAKNKKTLFAFSAVFPDVIECDESDFINAVISQGDLHAFFIRGDKLSPFGEIHKMLWSQDEPIWFPNMFWNWEICRSAQDNGVRVLLDGADGDNAVSHGWSHLTEMARSWKWINLYSEIRGLSSHLGVPFSRILLVRCIYPFVPKEIVNVWGSLRGYNKKEKSPEIFNSAFNSRISSSECQESYEDCGANSSREEHYQILNNGFIQYIMEIGDRLGASFSMEIRHPFYDKRLLEFCLALPADQKLRKGWSRWILRKSMEGILPPKVQWRFGKTNLSANYRHCLRKYDDAFIKEVLQNCELVKDYVNASFLNHVNQQFDSKDSNADAINLWRVVPLAVWLENKP